MKTNIRTTKQAIYTHEGGPATRTSKENELRRSVMACMLWEDTFYESGIEIGKRIADLVGQVDPLSVASIATQAREKMKLRHAPLWLAVAMTKYPEHKELVGEVLDTIIQRPDELSEFLSLYWAGKKHAISAQAKKGLASAFQKFDAYQLAKYNRDADIKLRDVLFLCHAKPKDKEQAETWKQLVDGTLPIPDTWETELSAGKDKKVTFERLINERKLGALALLRNLRNMKQVGVDEELIFQAINDMNTERVLPFRFITAARYAPQWESKIEKAMFKAIEGRRKLAGKTVLLVDVSGSMDSPISDKSELQRVDAATGLAILARELCENVSIFSFSYDAKRIPDRHGFALRDAIVNSQQHGGTQLGQALATVNSLEKYDRIIVITDEQSADRVTAPKGIGYIINVAAYQNGIGYGSWNHIDGWSEAVFDYIQASEE